MKAAFNIQEAGTRFAALSDFFNVNLGDDTEATTALTDLLSRVDEAMTRVQSLRPSTGYDLDKMDLELKAMVTMRALAASPNPQHANMYTSLLLDKALTCAEARGATAYREGRSPEGAGVDQAGERNPSQEAGRRQPRVWQAQGGNEGMGRSTMGDTHHGQRQGISGMENHLMLYQPSGPANSVDHLEAEDEEGEGGDEEGTHPELRARVRVNRRVRGGCVAARGRGEGLICAPRACKARRDADPPLPVAHAQAWPWAATADAQRVLRWSLAAQSASLIVRRLTKKASLRGRREGGEGKGGEGMAGHLAPRARAAAGRSAAARRPIGHTSRAHTRALEEVPTPSEHV
ncbi:hypothetical protein EV715DRAFT_268596 [Schizophyllum commune]